MNMTLEDIDRRIGMPDVDQEWSRFQREVIATSPDDAHDAPTNHATWRRAAIIALVCSLGFVALASVLYVGWLRPDAATMAEAPEAVVLDAEGDNNANVTADDAFVFDDVELQQIASQLAAHYGVELRIDNADAARMRLYVTLDQDMTLSDIVTYLNHLQGVNLCLDHQQLIVR